MRLERLEINGFKSFSDKSELAFDKGVTAIVGPNGCGKSNVADAITWVMGEQSAKSLRGDRMEDVLFNGSDARKPTATAEVRLRFSGFLKTVTGPALHPTAHSPRRGGPALPGANGHSGNGHHRNGKGNDNGNGHQVVEPLSPPADVEELIQSVAREVEVTRRLYRSGESEYLIDGQICRLKDIHDLLMDTGLGAKAYAIIEQGKIGMILSSRPTDRRQLIEEAAGVTKYRARRRAAELKLEAAQQNLTRIDDIVFEVEKQRAQLKRQAARARRYQRLRDELRRWEKGLFARKYRPLAAESAAYESAYRGIEGLEADVEAARCEVFSIANAATALGHAIEHATASRDRVAEVLSKLEVEAGDLRVEYDRVAADRVAAAQGLKRAHEGIELTRLARAARESELASARIEHEWRARSIRSLDHELAAREARLRSLEELDAARAFYGDAARTVLAGANSKVNQRGAIADYLEVDAGYERAVEACLGDLLQYVIVEQPECAS